MLFWVVWIMGYLYRKQNKMQKITLVASGCFLGQPDEISEKLMEMASGEPLLFFRISCYLFGADILAVDGVDPGCVFVEPLGHVFRGGCVVVKLDTDNVGPVLHGKGFNLAFL